MWICQLRLTYLLCEKVAKWLIIADIRPMYASTERRELSGPQFHTVLALPPEQQQAAQRLRYEVFVQEMGGDGTMVDHANRLERDQFDEHAGHLLLLDRTRDDGDQVIGTYRFMNTEMAGKAGQFYCENEYDLSILRNSGKNLLELGRSCLHQDYRGGTAMMHMWAGLSQIVEAHDIDIMFGVASFHGTDAGEYEQTLSLLHERHLAPEHLRVKAKGETAFSLLQAEGAEIDRLAAVKAMPALVKAYLRLGAVVGDGAFVDYAFNTVDICIVLEHAAINAMQRTIYAKGSMIG